MQRGSTILIFCQKICSILFCQNINQFRMPCPCSPMQWCHLQVINVECEVWVRLQKPLSILVSIFDHRKKLLTIVEIICFFNCPLIFDNLFQTEIFFLHFNNQLFNSISKPDTQIGIFPIMGSLAFIQLFRLFSIWLQKVAFLNNPRSCMPLLLLWYSKWNLGNYFVSIWNLLQFWRWRWWPWKINFQSSWKLPKIQWIRLCCNVLFIFQKLLKRSLFIILYVLFNKSVLND